jgi:hypothetical protein
MRKARPEISFANIVSNPSDTGYAVAYAFDYGMILDHCIFIGIASEPNFICRATRHGTLPFLLRNCVFDNQGNLPAGHYEIHANVITSNTGATLEIGHLAIQLYPAVIA